MKWYRLYKESSDSDFVIKDGVIVKYKGKGGEVVIPDGVSSIQPWAFAGCGELTSVTIPDGVESIRQEAFANCSGLKNITIPDSVTNIGYKAFYECFNLTSVTIGENMKSIGEYAFSGCTRLTSITIKGKNIEKAKKLLGNAVDDLSIVKGENSLFVVRFKYSHRTDDEQEFNANSPEEARRKFENWAADMENSEDFDFEFIDAKEA